ncbi:hypothetical protein SERLA73DRAFT_151822 [Serpula lacrymans var. lacrymans S7.3]|uniref:Uncharacterized protein n=2 Tax=Serpula lacrymans var. lacrymans TaxID=341189 RepID=F8PSZ9_SERL3|nr:hypothetical protein SERLA73DRAFT_151822 [Serpula lacrymans var. lacrymans S7.3]
MSRPVTCSKNANQRPGQIVLDMQVKRQNRAEVAEEKKQKVLDDRMTKLVIRQALAALAEREEVQAKEDQIARCPGAQVKLKKQTAPQRHQLRHSEREVTVSDSEGEGEGEGGLLVDGQEEVEGMANLSPPSQCPGTQAKLTKYPAPQRHHLCCTKSQVIIPDSKGERSSINIQVEKIADLAPSPVSQIRAIQTKKRQLVCHKTMHYVVPESDGGEKEDEEEIKERLPSPDINNSDLEFCETQPSTGPEYRPRKIAINNDDLDIEISEGPNTTTEANDLPGRRKGRARHHVAETSDKEQQERKKRKTSAREAISMLRMQLDLDTCHNQIKSTGTSGNSTSINGLGHWHQLLPAKSECGRQQWEEANVLWQFNVLKGWASDFATSAKSKKREYGKSKLTSTAATSVKSTSAVFEGGGLVDSNEDEVDERAALTGKKCTTSLALVKIEEGTIVPAPKCIKCEGPNVRVKPKNGDLPEGCHIENKWRLIFVPTFQWWLGTSENPWNLNDPKVTLYSPIYNVLGQQIYEWRNGFSSTAQAMVQHLFDTQPAFKSYDTRQGCPQSMLQGLNYIYKEVDANSLHVNFFSS